MKEVEEIGNSNRMVSVVLPIEEALPLDEAIRYATSLAEALRRVHQEGSVFGRVDTDHIVWNKSGVKLIQGGGEGITAYLSPEQVRGESADSRSDIFAFGAIFYELLSGRRAFPARDPEELKQEILSRNPAPISGVPDEIYSLVRRCLEKRREDRWQRINSILIELKLAVATARQAHSASELKERVTSIRAQIAAQDSRLTAHQASQDVVDGELRQSIQQVSEKLDNQGAEIARIHTMLASIHESIAVLQKSDAINAKAIEGLEAAASQTDEVVEHVVEAFGMMHQSVVERGESKVLLVARNAS